MKTNFLKIFACCSRKIDYAHTAGVNPVLAIRPSSFVATSHPPAAVLLVQLRAIENLAYGTAIGVCG